MPDTPIQIFERELMRQLGAPVPVGGSTEVDVVWEREGVEVAVARASIAPRSQRARWNERQANRGRPLLLVSPSTDIDTDERISVVGPSGEREPRQVEPIALANEIARSAADPPLRASRALDAAIASLSAQVLPGVIVKGLLTEHYVRTRLPVHRVSLRDQLAQASEPAHENRDWRGMLVSLGWEIEQRPDYGWDAVAGPSRAIVHPKTDAEEFSRMDEDGRMPEGVLIAACRRVGARWGIMTAGTRIRLFEAETRKGSATDRWVDLDLARLPDEHRYLIGLFAPATLADGGVWHDVIEDVRDFGAGLRDRLDGQIRKDALPGIARGLGQWVAEDDDGDLNDPDQRKRIQQATYSLLFRMLFILYAESAGHLPFGRSSGYTANALRTLCGEARARRDRLDADSTALWDRLRTLTRAIRNGDDSIGLPQYNGSLFDAEEMPGAELLEAAEVSDSHLGPVLEALGFDDDDETGLDYTNLEIGHLGSIYEGLLALRLSLADQTYGWDAKRDRFVPADESGNDGVAAGTLFFQTEAGGRKGGGVYYTRQEFVRHLVSHSVLPALDEHLEQVRGLAANDVDAAERLLFRFRVLDPAMGSGHFLVDALDVIAERVQQFLAETPLPPLRVRLESLRAEAGAAEVGDAQLLKRVLLKHCIYGVDLSEMAVELARVALWLSSFVPGLALSYLDQTLRRGDSLVGVASIEAVLSSSGGGAARSFWGMPGGPLDQAIEDAGSIAAEIADLADRNKEEVERSRHLRESLESKIAGARRAFDLWTSEPFGHDGARAELDRADEIIDGTVTDARALRLLDDAAHESSRRSFFHWPLEFPEVFHRGFERDEGFDAVVGNPPWDEVTVEELGFYALHDPGLRGLNDRAEQDSRIFDLKRRFPRLEAELEQRQVEAAAQRAFFRPDSGYALQGSGDLDLYELFCERYQSLARNGGRVGVVLPRTTFLAAGSRAFRRWLFANCTVARLDFIQNTKRWAFPIHPQNPTIALLALHVQPPPKGALLTTTGPSRSLDEFITNANGAGTTVLLDEVAAWTPSPLAESSTDPAWELPLMPTQDHARLLGRMRSGPRFDRWAESHGRVFPVSELHETNDRRYFRQSDGVAVWKGRSFNQFDPHGSNPAGHAKWGETLEFVHGKRTSRVSNFRGRFPTDVLADSATHPMHSARVAFRDVTNRTNSRTVLACLVPPRTPLVNSAPYLVFPTGNASEEAYALGVMNSLSFDWQARRFVETHLNFYVLNLLCFPPEDAIDVDGIAGRAALLSCPDDRFAEFAGVVGIEFGPHATEVREQYRAEIDALVAIGYGLGARDLEVIFSDFSTDAVPDTYRTLVREKFTELTDGVLA